MPPPFQVRLAHGSVFVSESYDESHGGSPCILHEGVSLGCTILLFSIHEDKFFVAPLTSWPTINVRFKDKTWHIFHWDLGLITI